LRSGFDAPARPAALTAPGNSLTNDQFVAVCRRGLLFGLASNRERVCLDSSQFGPGSGPAASGNTNLRAGGLWSSPRLRLQSGWLEEARSKAREVFDVLADEPPREPGRATSKAKAFRVSEGSVTRIPTRLADQDCGRASGGPAPPPHRASGAGDDSPGWRECQFLRPSHTPT
jgi:hypothetical protein